ncbi:MAG: type IV pilus biogenesis/stability protein PilW [Paraglaciecola sp.]|nr:type IV pilus biogenesis/stability protein PilW [Paraglaciecola sp.]
MLKIISIVFIMLMLLSGCVSQSSQNSGQNFDRIKAAKTRVSLGLTYLKNGNFSKAKFNLDKALEFAPRSADANFAMAYYYQRVDEVELAENAYQFAMRLEPKNANIANSYGAFLCQNGDYEKAKKYFLKAVNTRSYASSAETYENLALCSRSQGRPEDAIQYLRSAVNHQPGRATGLFLLSRSLIEAQQWQEARVFLRRYEKTSRINPQSLWMSMQIEQGIGNASAAKGYADMLLKIYPNDPVTTLMLASQQPSSLRVNTIEKFPVAMTASNTVLKRVKPQPTEKSFTPTVKLPEKSNLVVKQQDANDNILATDELRQSKVSVTEPLTGQGAQMKSKILPAPTFHIVAKDENLYRISLLYNIKMQRLIDWNGLVDASAIFDGKKLFLVAPSVVE